MVLTRSTHYKIKYSCAVPFNSGSYMFKLWVDCSCPQICVAKVENCWLLDSYPTVLPTMITPDPTLPDHTHPTCLQTSKLCLPLYSFVHQTKGLLFCCLIGVLGHCLKILGPEGLSNILQHNCALFCNVLGLN